VDPVPDPLLLRKSGSAGDRTRDLCICSQKLWPLDHRGGPKTSPLDTIISQFYPTPTLHLSHSTLPHSTFIPIFCVPSVSFPRCLSTKVLHARLVSLFITAAAIHSNLLHFANLTAKEAILCQSQCWVCVLRLTCSRTQLCSTTSQHKLIHTQRGWHTS